MMKKLETDIICLKLLLGQIWVSHEAEVTKSDASGCFNVLECEQAVAVENVRGQPLESLQFRT